MAAPVAFVPDDDYVLLGNSWSHRLDFPLADAAGVALVWGTFSVSSTPALPIEVIRNGNAVTLFLPADAIDGSFVWYVAEDANFGGNSFLAGRVHVQGRRPT